MERLQLAPAIYGDTIVQTLRLFNLYPPIINTPDVRILFEANKAQLDSASTIANDTSTIKAATTPTTRRS